MTIDPLNVEPHDLDQLHEITLVTDLMIACSQCPQEHLPADMLDALLGVHPGNGVYESIQDEALVTAVAFWKEARVGRTRDTG